MASENLSELRYSLNDWEKWVNAKCVELNLPSLYGYLSIRDWCYNVGKTYGWAELRNMAFLDTLNIYSTFAKAYVFLVELSLKSIVDTCDYSEMLEVL